MNLFTTFFSDKTLVTILKCLPLPEDNNRKILEHLMAQIITEDIWWNQCLHEEFWWYTNFANTNPDSYIDIDIYDH